MMMIASRLDMIWKAVIFFSLHCAKCKKVTLSYTITRERKILKNEDSKRPIGHFANQAWVAQSMLSANQR